jgi:hypothetical protein
VAAEKGPKLTGIVEQHLVTDLSPSVVSPCSASATFYHIGHSANSSGFAARGAQCTFPGKDSD